VEKGCPTDYAIDEAAHGLSRYARICQEAGLVPIVEPEILIDGTHDIETTAKVQEKVVSVCYQKLKECGVLLEGTLLKPSMTVAGVDCTDKPTPQDVSKYHSILLILLYIFLNPHIIFVILLFTCRLLA